MGGVGVGIMVMNIHEMRPSCQTFKYAMYIAKNYSLSRRLVAFLLCLATFEYDIDFDNTY